MEEKTKIKTTPITYSQQSTENSTNNRNNTNN